MEFPAQTKHPDINAYMVGLTIGEWQLVATEQLLQMVAT
jgi:hypothetical protein